jgi:cysteinyl-tRNA synthetase
MADGRRLQFSNTLTRAVSPFVPIDSDHARMYTCGPTVYGYAHIGNMRAYVFSDTVHRALLWKGFDVRQVMNITDVGHLTSDEDEGEDKVEVASRREGRSIWEIAEHYTTAFREDLGALRILPPTVWCKATDHITDMIAFAERLEATGYCYRLPSGLYFDTAKDPSYGRLARLGLAGQQEGARVEAVEGRRSPADFAVWRTTPPGEHRQMGWDSPWGGGAPGWHLECSVMSIKYLGDHFDIHTGGVDHVPVHHVNEIAQSQAYLGDGEARPWVNWWLHCDFINLKRAKMSKSAGTGIRLGDLVEAGFHPAVYRYLLLGAHYRAQVDFDLDALRGAKTTLRRLLERIGRARIDRHTPLATFDSSYLHISSTAARSYLEELDEAICADLNTSRALAVMTSAARDESLDASDLSGLVASFDALLGLGLLDLRAEDLDIASPSVAVDVAEIENLMAERTAARNEGHWDQADVLRDRLAGLGVTVKDNPGGSTWSWTS